MIISVLCIYDERSLYKWLGDILGTIVTSADDIEKQNKRWYDTGSSAFCHIYEFRKIWIYCEWNRNDIILFHFFCNLMGIRYFYIPSCPAFYIKIAFFILVVYTLVSPFILAVLILPCKGKAYGRIPSTVSLSVIWFYRQPSTNQRFGYSNKIITAYLAYHPFMLLFSACKIHSRQWNGA